MTLARQDSHAKTRAPFTKKVFTTSQLPNSLARSQIPSLSTFDRLEHLVYIN